MPVCECGLLVNLAASASHRAAEALSQLIYQEVLVKSSHVYGVSSPEMLMVRLRSPRSLFAITQTVYGREHGRVSFVFSKECAGILVDLVTGRHGTATRVLGGLEFDALKETANIVVGCYLGRLADKLGLDETPSLPSLVEGPTLTLVQSFVLHPRSLCIESRLLAPQRGIEMMLLTAVAQERVAAAPAVGGKPANSQPASVRQ